MTGMTCTDRNHHTSKSILFSSVDMSTPSSSSASTTITHIPFEQHQIWLLNVNPTTSVCIAGQESAIQTVTFSFSGTTEYFTVPAERFRKVFSIDPKWQAEESRIFMARVDSHIAQFEEEQADKKLAMSMEKAN